MAPDLNDLERRFTAILVDVTYDIDGFPVEILIAALLSAVEASAVSQGHGDHES